jgi:hypothetical protein
MPPSSNSVFVLCGLIIARLLSVRRGPVLAKN